jgi:hypothetical protein
MTKPIRRGRNFVARPKPRNNTRWREVFLERLAETSNVTASCEWAHIGTSQVYASRRAEPEFARKWQAALCEGYDNLEMELLYRLRAGDTGEAGGKKFEYAVALRLLGAHRESAARERAMRDNEDADVVLAEIDAKLDKMRERALAAGELDDDPATQ